MPVEYLSDRYHPTTEKTARLKVRSIRTVIDVLFHTGLDEIMVAAIPGIKIVRKAYTRPPQEDCAGYFFKHYFRTLPPDETLFRLTKTIMKTYPMVEVSQANDIVIYNDSNNNPMHIGRGLKDGYVISKWGPSHVYRHPLLYVPSVYGNPLIYRHPSLIQA